MNEKTLTSVLNIVKIAIAAIGTFLMIYVAGKWDEEANNIAEISGMLDLSFNIIYAIIIISAVIILGFGIVQFASRIKDNLGLLAGVVGFILVMVIAWFTSTVESPIFLKTVYSLSEAEAGVSKFAGAGVNTVFYLIILAVIAVIVAELTKIFK